MLRRTGASGGGAPSITKIAQERFDGRMYCDLEEGEKAEVLLERQHLFRWHNVHQYLRVFSSKCKKYVTPTRIGSVAGSPHLDILEYGPCSECRSLLKTPEFKNTLRRPTPHEDNYKYVNSMYRNDIIGEQYLKSEGLKELVDAAKSIQHDDESVFIKFAKGAIQGKYEDNAVFLGLVRAMVQKIDRKDRGVGMQNFTYAPAWDEFVQIPSSL
ncbi:hypothetical protein MPER_03340 [Moniliophthora perniciosa FA553]|nr:hypothetical protein MPER_03340 [Moniliophthora perniciosa FA553]